ncbi:hypothetical protein [Ideonella sp.]|uniref:hypothetical protein n=1 Tax=Ideonella sp. TaxID=1929293 RepID=UPI0035AE37F7
MPHSVRHLRSSRLATKILLPLVTVLLSGSALARADEALMLRIRQVHAGAPTTMSCSMPLAGISSCGHH